MTKFIRRNFLIIFTTIASAAIFLKWFNPFSVKKYGRDQCLELYENHLRNTPGLYDCLEELKGKELGCWCKPNSCHGDIIIKLLHEKSEEK